MRENFFLRRKITRNARRGSKAEIRASGGREPPVVVLPTGGSRPPLANVVSLIQQGAHAPRSPAKSHVIRRRSRGSAAAGPVGVEELFAGLVDTFVGVGAEIIALGLEEVGGEPGTTVAVEVGQGRAHRRQGNAVGNAGADGPAPAGLGPLHLGRKIRID